MSGTSAIGRSNGRRWALTLAVVLPPLFMLGVATIDAARAGSVPELPCWVLPNLQVMAAPGNDECPIGARQTIRRAGHGNVVGVRDHHHLHSLLETDAGPLRVGVLEGTQEQWLDLPISTTLRPTRFARIAVALLAVVSLLGIPLFLIWRSSSRAAVPLACFYGIVSVVVVTITTGQHSLGMTRFALLGLVFAPASAIHLAFTFPRERPVVREVPALIYTPYVLSALLVPVGWVSLERDPLLWPAFVSLLAALTGGAWIVLMMSCWFAVRESRSAVERARSRLVLYGALLVPVVPTLVLTVGTRNVEQILVFYLWSAAATMPLSIAIAIGRYNLFDLGSDVRHTVARVLYLGIAASVVALVFGAALGVSDAPAVLREPAPLFLVACMSVAVVEPLRGRFPGLLEALIAPRMQPLREERDAFERELGIRRDGDEIAALLGRALQRGIAPRRASVLLGTAGSWRLAYRLGGDAALRRAALEEAERLTAGRSKVHLAESPEVEAAAAELCEAGIEAVFAIESGGERYGLLLLGHPRERAGFTGVELDFVGALVAQAGIALRNAHITAELVAAERHAATGRIALGLAHDVGKDLGWMRVLVKRLPERTGDSERLARDASMIGELTESLAGAIERFVSDATSGSGQTEMRRLEEIVHDTVRRIERLHDTDRIACNVDPALRGLRVHSSLGRAIGNLLDNALHASSTVEPVRLIATRDGRCVEIAIEDRGCGISEQALGRVFEPGFTTRAHEGGSGVGLPVALEIVGALRGTLDLSSSPRGTRATIRVPASEPPYEEASS